MGSFSTLQHCHYYKDSHYYDDYYDDYEHV